MTGKALAHHLGVNVKAWKGAWRAGHRFGVVRRAERAGPYFESLAQDCAAACGAKGISE